METGFLKINLLFFLLLAFPCRGADDEDSKSWKHPDPITYDLLRAWHSDGGLKDRCPVERHLDLNGDGNDEVFLGIAAYSRGMTYALFTHTDKGWILLSDEIEGNAPFELLPEKHGSWHDFMVTLPTWRGRGYWRFVYTWNGKHYVGKSDREIKDSELSKP